MNSLQIRKSFIEFFERKGHAFVPSTPVVPADDPTLMFTNAGMNQFKELFLGLGERSYNRACNWQKCIRVSGKHNDLEEVGLDTYHHTFFEMLGNWSFGDYYKKEAIEWAWELLTKVYRLPEDKLYATVYNDDDESFEIWEKFTSLDNDKILRFGEKDNFWEMGEIGPCGPCSEIHIDMGTDACDKKHVQGHTCRVNGSCARYIEIWNLVFIQFDRKRDSSLEELKSKHVDTGMGLERLVAILQKKDSNYDTDIFIPTIQNVEKISAIKYKDDPVPFRVIADHIRTLCFAIGDGVVPSNDGRGYVIRRILRRASRYGKKLNLDKAFLCETALSLIEQMKEVYPELVEKKDYIFEVIKSEEESFLITLDQGIQRFESLVNKEEIRQSKLVPGAEVFRLYDTFGFPVDLTNLMAREEGLDVDMDGFNIAMAEQRDRARKGAKGQDILLRKLEELKGKLDKTVFTGFQTLSGEAAITAIFENSRDGGNIEDLSAPGDRGEYWITSDKSPCYGESGGQAGDRGLLLLNNEPFAKLIDTQKREDRIFHLVQIDKKARGSISAGSKIRWQVDEARRKEIEIHHTATHALQYALRKVLGNHVGQSGSLVMPDRLRFDFSHFKAMTNEEIQKTEDIVNELISKRIKLSTEVTSIREAKEKGAIAFFGEKYGERVRVVALGRSIELCGGTHVDNSSAIRIFKILKESSPGSSIRRIEAVAGRAAEIYLRQQSRRMAEVSRLLGVTPDSAPEAVKNLLEKNKELRKGSVSGNSNAPPANINFSELEKNAGEISGFRVWDNIFPEGTDISILRDWADRFRNREQAGICLFGAFINGKAILVFAASKGITPKPIDCNLLIKKASPYIKGGGGGRPDMVQAGGKEPKGLREAIRAAISEIESMGI